MDTETRSAVVVGADACGLGLARSLGAGGVPVIVVDSDRRRPGMHSRYALPFSCGLSGPALVEGLLRLRSSLDHDPVLFLTTDPQVRTVSEHRHQLERGFVISLPDHHCVNELLHKAGFQAVAESEGFPVPRTLFIRSHVDIGRIAELRFPAVIKPGDKKLFFERRAPRAMRVRTAAEAEAACRSLLPTAPDLVLQEWIDGLESDIYFCLQFRPDLGKAAYSFTGRKLRCWPPQTGSTASCLPAPEVSTSLEPLTSSFFEKTRCVGMCGMEFKLDRRTGAFFMIEPTIGRADWQEEVATLNGVNIPLAAYRHMLSLPPPEQKRSRRTVIWRDPACYWRAVLAAPSRREEIPADATIMSSCWRSDDPVPLAYCCLEWVQKMWSPARWAN